MGRRTFTVMMLAAALVLATAVRPGRAAGGDFTDGLVITGYVAGGVTAITLIAILLAGDDDPEYMSLTGSRPPRDPGTSDARVRYGAACLRQGRNMPLMCW